MSFDNIWASVTYPKGARIKVLDDDNPPLRKGHVYEVDTDAGSSVIVKSGHNFYGINKNNISLVSPHNDTQSLTLCECGADITYGPNTSFHSEWCAKHNK